MTLDNKTKQHLERTLRQVDEHNSIGTRLIDDAHRLWARAQKFIRVVGLDPATLELDAMELVCYALQLPMRQPLPAKLGRTNLRDRTEQATELLLGILPDADESLLDRASRMLYELPQRSPIGDESKLLADVVNLDDFGITGLIVQAIAATRQGGGVSLVGEGCSKREQYGYLEARIKDGFHFEPIRQIAETRLATSRQVCKLLLDELKEDQP